MQKAEKRLGSILRKAKSAGVSRDQFKNFDVVSKLKLDKSNCKYKYVAPIIFVLISMSILSCINFLSDECFLDMPIDASKIFREPETCDICEGLDKVDKVKNITPNHFEDYVASGKPLVVTDGTRGWSAVDVFTFDFFKSLYENADSRNECQFFPYKTEFRSLDEVWGMSEARARLEEGEKPWYVGWSNCNDNAGKVLRSHYERPYFLPPTSENLALNWIFMGGPGFGAQMHVDNVHYPSWQAQLKGRKLWRLAPPPECIYKCQEIQVIVEPGEIIVVDTNRWYHQTHILPGSISITIGSEFD